MFVSDSVIYFLFASINVHHLCTQFVGRRKINKTCSSREMIFSLLFFLMNEGEMENLFLPGLYDILTPRMSEFSTRQTLDFEQLLSD